MMSATDADPQSLSKMVDPQQRSTVCCGVSSDDHHQVLLTTDTDISIIVMVYQAPILLLEDRGQ